MNSHEIEYHILLHFEALLNEEQIDQQNFMKALLQLIFCLCKQISQFPSLFNDMKNQINKLYNKITNDNMKLQTLNYLKDENELIKEKLQNIVIELNKKIDSLNNSLITNQLSNQNKIAYSYQQLSTTLNETDINI